MATEATLDLKKSLIRKQAFFSQLSEEEVDVLCDLLTEKHFKVGEVIVTQGDPVDSVFLIVTGTADVRLVTIQDGAPQFKSIATLGPEQAIGLNETGFYSISGIRTATVVALTEMFLLRLSVAAFHGFELAYPHVFELMHKNTSILKQTE